jgi:hypothetical protein
MKAVLLYFVVEHHPAVFMFEVVAMENVFAEVVRETDNDTDFLSGERQHGVLPACFPYFEPTTPTRALQHLELPGMEVHGMGFSAGSVVEFPDFGRPGVHHNIAAVGVEKFAIERVQHAGHRRAAMLHRMPDVERARCGGFRFCDFF